MSSDISEQGMNEILDLIYAGRKVAACKRYIELRKQERDEITSILEAKTFVESLTEKLKAAEPERFANLPKQGCTAGFLLLTASGGLFFSFGLWVLGHIWR